MCPEFQGLLRQFERRPPVHAALFQASDQIRIIIWFISEPIGLTLRFIILTYVNLRGP